MEEGAKSQGTQVASRSWNSQGNAFFPRHHGFSLVKLFWPLEQKGDRTVLFQAIHWWHLVTAAQETNTVHSHYLGRRSSTGSVREGWGLHNPHVRGPTQWPPQCWALQTSVSCSLRMWGIEPQPHGSATTAIYNMAPLVTDWLAWWQPPPAWSEIRTGWGKVPEVLLGYFNLELRVQGQPSLTSVRGCLGSRVHTQGWSLQTSGQPWSLACPHQTQWVQRYWLCVYILKAVWVWLAILPPWSIPQRKAGRVGQHPGAGLNSLTWIEKSSVFQKCHWPIMPYDLQDIRREGRSVLLHTCSPS